MKAILAVILVTTFGYLWFSLGAEYTERKYVWQQRIIFSRCPVKLFNDLDSAMAEAKGGENLTFTGFQYYLKPGETRERLP